MNNLSDEELEFIRKTKEKVESMNLFKKIKLWSDEEKQYLIDNYKEKTFKEIGEDLNIDSKSVRKMASKMNLAKRVQLEQWQIDYLKENYPNLKVSYEEMSEYLGKTKNAIKYYANDVLGLRRNNFWTKEDEDLLKKLYYEGQKVKDISVQIGRSESATSVRISRMKLKRGIEKTNDNSNLDS